MKSQTLKPRFAICINNGGYADDLKVRTIYQILPDDSAAKSNYVRIVDETGEDYLYPAVYFVLIDLPREVERILSPLPYAKTPQKHARKKTVEKSRVYAAAAS